MALQHTIKAVVRKGDSQYVAECLELGVVTQGSTAGETLENLQEAVTRQSSIRFTLQANFSTLHRRFCLVADADLWNTSLAAAHETRRYTGFFG